MHWCDFASSFAFNFKSREWATIPQPSAYEADALPIELSRKNGHSGNRTHNLPVNSRALHLLSYVSTTAEAGLEPATF